jgi:microcystin degradation protein MlrC
MGQMRVALGSIMHETNSFSPIQTPFEAFHEGMPDILDGQRVLDAMRGTKTGIGGFMDVGAEQGWEMIGTVSAHATPSANVQAEAHNRLKGRLVQHIRDAGKLDGVLLYLHGAMLAENAPDAEGDICKAVREVVGPDVPIITALDLHGNMTEEFCKQVDGVFVYDTNPHIDSWERGVEAAECMAKVLNGEMPRPKVLFVKPPMLPPTINMRTAEGPMTQLLDRGQEWEAGDGIVNVAVFPGFPYADFDQAGTSIIVTATDEEIGRRAIRDMGQFAWSIRDQFLKEIPDVPAAVEQALQQIGEPGGLPVILADVADNPGGGGTGDTTELLRELIRRGAHGAAACVWDPETVQQAFVVGIGNTADFKIAGKAAPEAYGAPLEVRGRVTHLSDGHFTGWGPVMRGRAGNAGPTACIDVNGLKLVVTTFRHAANDRGFFQVAGVQPDREPLLVIKSRGHFRADFQPIAKTIIEVDAPGAANPGLARYEFKNVRRPLWPLDRDMTWEP